MNTDLKKNITSTYGNNQTGEYLPLFNRSLLFLRNGFMLYLDIPSVHQSPPYPEPCKSHHLYITTTGLQKHANPLTMGKSTVASGNTF